MLFIFLILLLSPVTLGQSLESDESLGSSGDQGSGALTKVFVEPGKKKHTNFFLCRFTVISKMLLFKKQTKKSTNAAIKNEAANKRNTVLYKSNVSNDSLSVQYYTLESKLQQSQAFRVGFGLKIDKIMVLFIHV